MPEVADGIGVDGRMRMSGSVYRILRGLGGRGVVMAGVLGISFLSVFADETNTRKGIESITNRTVQTSAAKTEEPKTNKTMTVDLGGGVKMEMVWIPAGEFDMGSNEFSGEKPIHRVKLTKGFWMGKYEVTQEQWERVMGKNPANFKGAKNPVDTVSWHDCPEFLKKLNGIVQEGGFRLPTEAEWEYACRAGTKTKFYSGDNDSDLVEAGWYSGNSDGKTHPVGEKKPNVFGLHDMHGNVWEWCQDWYGDYPSETVSDPTGSSSGSYRVLRGGSWYCTPSVCRSAVRPNYGVPSFAGIYIGFRVVCVR
jgi:formylglycine-generating enzyme required for sulfatase activity